MRLAALLAASLLAPSIASAVTDPTPGKEDSRIRSARYDPDQVIRLTSTGLSPVQVILEAGENQVTVAGTKVFTNPKKATDSGVQSYWVAAMSGNVLILQPNAMIEPTVLFLRTNTADGHERHYSFEVQTREGAIADPNDREAYMTVRMVYPIIPTPESEAQARAKREVAEARSLDANFAVAEDSGWRNYAYDKRSPGCTYLAPVVVFDDGVRTTLMFTPGAVLPEVYVVNQDGKEAISTTVNNTTRAGLQVVVPSVQHEMRLRRGGQVCALRDNAYEMVGQEPGGGSGTVSANVTRTVRVPAP